MSKIQTLADMSESNGWRLNSDFIESVLQERPNMNANDLMTLALDTDLKTSGKKYLPDGIMNGKSDSIDGPCVVQIVKIRNVAAPKENETSQAAPPFFKITLTDGTCNCNALCMDDIQGLNLDTPPGTKILLKGTVKTKSSSLLLYSKCCVVLGGHVDYLVQKWRANKDILSHVRDGTGNSTADAPPAWVPFGQKQVNKVDTTKKSLQQQVNKEDDGTSDFSQSRQAAVAEAMQDKLKVNKTFTQQTTPQVVFTTTERPQSGSSTTATSAFTGNTFNTNKPEFVKRGSRFSRNNRDGDDERDYKETSKAPSSMTLFDAIKTKLQIKDTDDGNSDQPSQSAAQSKPVTSNNWQQQQQQREQPNRPPRNPRGDSANYQPTENKERRNNLPPRFQRANDEKERFNSTSNQPVQQQRRPQKYNNNNNDNHRYNNNQHSPQETYNKDDYAYDLNANKVNETTTSNSKQQVSATSMPSQQQQHNDDDTSSKPIKQHPNNNNNSKPTGGYNKSTNRYQQSGTEYSYNEQHTLSYQSSNQYQKRKQHANQNVNNGSYYASPSQQQQQIGLMNVIQVSFTTQQPSATNNTTTTTVANTSAPVTTNQALNVQPYINLPGIPLTPVFYSAESQVPHPYYHTHPHHHAQQAQYDPYFCPVITTLPYAPHPATAIHIQPPPAHLLAAPNGGSMAPTPSQPQQQQSATMITDNVASNVQNKNEQAPSKPIVVNNNQLLNDNNNNNTSDKNNNNNKNAQNVRLWKKGDQCYAKYYSDNKFYPAYIEAIEKGSNTCYVSYIGYNEGAEVKLVDIKPFKDDAQRPHSGVANNSNANQSSNATRK